jgi:phytoene dehydrogenase-like protein
VFTLSDIAKLASLRLRLATNSGGALGTSVSTAQYLNDLGFSRQSIEQFFKPFFGGVFLDPQLSVSAAMFEFVFRMFANGGAAVPAQGMAAIPEQLAGRLPTGSILLGERVVDVKRNRVRLESGRDLEAAAVVVATDATEAQRLDRKSLAPIWRGTSTLYFSAPETPLERPALVLRGEEHGPINHLCVPSDIAPEYAPKGASLISVSVLAKTASSPQDDLRSAVENQLTKWFGSQVRRWDHLATYAIPRALPAAYLPTEETSRRSGRMRPGIYACGDYMATPSINGAVVSGHAAAYGILQDEYGRRGNAVPGIRELRAVGGNG